MKRPELRIFDDSFSTLDMVLVLDDGRIVGRGTRSELLETPETYREIVNFQLAGEETVWARTPLPPAAPKPHPPPQPEAPPSYAFPDRR